MVFKYMDGRILDLFRRLSGEYNQFFLPQDNEVSLKYLQWVITRAKKKDCIIQSERKTIYDKYGIDRLVNFITIYKVEKQDKGNVNKDVAPRSIIKKHRLFFKDFDGALVEIKQAKVLIKKHELHKLKSMVNKGGFVTGHGEFDQDKDGLGSAIEETEQLMYERENPQMIERESTYSKPREGSYQISFANRENRAGTQDQLNGQLQESISLAAGVTGLSRRKTGGGF